MENSPWHFLLQCDWRFEVLKWKPFTNRLGDQRTHRSARVLEVDQVCNALCLDYRTGVIDRDGT